MNEERVDCARCIVSVFLSFFCALSLSVQVFVGWQLLYFYFPFVFVAIVVDDF